MCIGWLNLDRSGAPSGAGPVAALGAPSERGPARSDSDASPARGCANRARALIRSLGGLICADQLRAPRAASARHFPSLIALLLICRCDPPMEPSGGATSVTGLNRRRASAR